MRGRPIDRLCFFGAGCGTEDSRLKMRRHLTVIGPELRHIMVNTDLAAAARVALGHKPGTCALIGTGSVAFSFDGSEITHRKGGHGFLLGDTSGGITLGKALINAYLKGEMPCEVQSPFERSYGGLTSSQLMAMVYQKTPKQSLAFLGKQTRFIEQYLQHPWIKNLVRDSLNGFIEIDVKPCFELSGEPLVFGGGLTHLFHELVFEQCRWHKLPNPVLIKDPLADALYSQIWKEMTCGNGTSFD